MIGPSFPAPSRITTTARRRGRSRVGRQVTVLRPLRRRGIAGGPRPPSPRRAAPCARRSAPRLALRGARPNRRRHRGHDGKMFCREGREWARIGKGEETAHALAWANGCTGNGPKRRRRGHDRPPPSAPLRLCARLPSSLAARPTMPEAPPRRRDRVGRFRVRR